MMTLNYESEGQGMPVLLLHAFPLSSEMWKLQLNNLGEIARVITPDLPGLGISPLQMTPSISKMAMELAGFLDALKIREPIILAGLSMGGYVALEFMRQFPQRVKGLGLFSTKAGADSLETREKRLKTIQHIQSDGLEPFAQSLLSSLLGNTTLEAKPEVVKEVTRLILGNKRDGVTASLLAMAERRDSTDILSRIDCPTLIMAGREDTMIPVSEAEAMQKKIPGSQLELFSKAGHLINLEQPEEFQSIFEDFIDSFQ